MVLFILISCEKEESNEGEQPLLSDILTNAYVDENVGIFSTDNLPEATSSIIPIIEGSSQVIKGGSLILLLETNEPCNKIFVGNSTVSDTAQNYLNAKFINHSKGHFVINFDNSTNKMDRIENTPTIPAIDKEKILISKQLNSIYKSSDDLGEVYLLIITFSESTPYNSFTLNIVVNSSSGTSQITEHKVVVNPTASASDFLQVSLNWAYPVDLDLHVETPNGNDIYFGTPVGQNGGILDLDSNPACNIDNINNENITWGYNTPASGTYKVRADLWSSCNYYKSIPFVVTVNLKGNTTISSGEFSPSEETYGAAFSGRMISTFSF